MSKGISKKLSKVNPSMTLFMANKAKQMKDDGVKVYSFAAGEPDFDTPEVIADASNEACEKGITRYTEVKGLIDLRKAISEKYKKEFNLDFDPETEIIVNSGAKHSLYLALETLLDEGDEVIIPKPYWVSYSEMVKIAGGVPVIVETKKEDDFVLNPEELKKYITEKTKLIMFNSPSNPTGVVYSREQLEQVAKICLDNDIYILSDEIYEKLVYGDSKFIPMASISEEIKDITITINGMSKTYAMTGWRLGYTLANKEIISAMSTIQGQCISHPSSISQYAGITALRTDQSIVDAMVKEYDKRRKYMMSELDDIANLSYIKPNGAFYIFVDVSKFYGKKAGDVILDSSIKFSEALLDSKHVATVPGIGFGEDDFVRFSYATGLEDIKIGMKLFKEFIKELK